MRDAPPAEIVKVTRSSALSAATLAVLVAACMRPPRGPPPHVERAAPTPVRTAERDLGEPVRGRPELRVRVRAAEVLRYDAQAIGPERAIVVVRVTNAGERAASIGAVRVRFSATRGSTSMKCGPVDQLLEREPSELAPGESVEFDRILPCSLPLPGRYEIAARVGVGPDEAAAAFGVEVVADGGATPRPVPSRDGLYALMTGSPMTLPLPTEAWERGDYRVVVAFINGGERPIAVGPARLAIDVYRVGSPFHCSGAAEPLAGPDMLAPGATCILHASIACAPVAEGDYDVVGSLALDARDEMVEIGRLRLKVTRDAWYVVPPP